MTQAQEKVQAVMAEHATAAGGALAEQIITIMLKELLERYGQNFTLEGARNALDDLAKTAKAYSAELVD